MRRLYAACCGWFAMLVLLPFTPFVADPEDSDRRSARTLGPDSARWTDVTE